MKKIKYLGIAIIIATIMASAYPCIVNAMDMTQNVTLSTDVTDGIVVKSGSNVTLNLNGKNVTNTTGGDTITVEEGANLTITGSGTVTNDTHGKAVIFNSGTLNINNGTFTRSEVQGRAYYTVVNHGTMNVNGGIIKIESTPAGDGNWNSSVIDNGWVDGKQNTKGTKAVLTINAGTIEIANDKYIKNDDFGEIIVNGGTFNAGEKASAVIANIGDGAKTTINAGTFNCKGKNEPIWIYTGTGKINGGKFNLPSFTRGISDPPIENLLPKDEGSKDYNVVDKNGNQTGEKIILKDATVSEKVETEKVDKSSISDDETKAIENAAKEKLNNNYKIAGYYNIDLFKVVNNNLKIEKVDESSNTVTVTLNVPDTVEAVKDGYERTYYVVRVHNGVTDILDATLNNDGTVSFKTDKFSTYSLAYVDTQKATTGTTENGNNNTGNANSETTTAENAKETKGQALANETNNPKTGDTIVFFVILLVVALAGMALTFKADNKRVKGRKSNH